MFEERRNQDFAVFLRSMEVVVGQRHTQGPSRKCSPLSIVLRAFLLNNILNGIENGHVMRSRIRLELIRAKVISTRMTKLAALKVDMVWLYD